MEGFETDEVGNVSYDISAARSTSDGELLRVPARTSPSKLLMKFFVTMSHSSVCWLDLSSVLGVW